MEAPVVLADILRQPCRIAVVGLSWKPHRASHGVAAYLQGAGFRIFPVNPELSGPVLGELPYPSLAHLPEPVEVIDIFRRSEDTPPLVQEILHLPWRPRLAWFQQGIRPSSADRSALEAAGIAVVEDRCLLVEHRALHRA